MTDAIDPLDRFIAWALVNINLNDTSHRLITGGNDG